jgi:hypothetical protein
MIWSVPGSLLAARFGFAVFTPFYALYALLSALIVFRVARGLMPERPLLAVLTAAFMLVWAPGDLARLSTMERAVYQGIALGSFLALGLFVESWLRQSAPMLGAAVLTAFLAIRCYEGGAALLAGAPLLLLLTQERSRRLWRWTLIWELVVGIALAFFLLEMSVGSRQQTYQMSVLGMHTDPLDWVARMGWQYVYHLAPLFASAPRELITPAVPAALAGFALALLLAGLGGGPEPRRPLLLAALLGLVFAGLGYSVILVGVDAPTAFRLQFLSGPGIAWCLAALVLLLASALPTRARAAAVLALGGWVVAVGTGRTLAMQRGWDRASFHGRQFRMLRSLVRAVPDLKPHTLLVLLDDGRAWRGGFGFHHAAQYLYERRAAGYVPGLWDPLYPAAPAPQGIRFEPWPIVRRAWDAPRTLYRYDELVVLRHDAQGAVSILETWPAELKALPEGARYAPRARLAAGALPRARILER